MHPPDTADIGRCRPNRRGAVLGTVITLTAASVLAAGHAEATDVTRTGAVTPHLTALQCLGTESDTYSPGVTIRPRPFTITTAGQFSSCIDSAGMVTSGAYGPEQVSLDVGCSDLFDAFQGVRTIRWNTGDTSTLEGDGQSTEVAGQVITTFTGTVSQGRFQGLSAVQTITLPQPGALQCLTTGYTGATGVTTLTID